MTHGHFLLNGKRVDIPSIRLSIGDILVVRPQATKSGYFSNLDDISPAPSEIPGWLKIDRKKLQVAVVSLPTREDAELDINEQLIVEYYSR
jgi:small subunit ribosomal protein S4